MGQYKLMYLIQISDQIH